MTAFIAVVGGLALFVWAVVASTAAVEANQRADRARKARDQWRGRADRYCHLYHDAVRTNAALLEHIGDEREAEAARALADTPEFYSAKALTVDEQAWESEWS